MGTGGFDRLCKAEKSFCLQLEASLKGGGKLKWVPLDEVQASITGQHSFAFAFIRELHNASGLRLTSSADQETKVQRSRL